MTTAAGTDPRRQATEKWHQSVRWVGGKANKRNEKGRLYIPSPPAYLSWKATQIFKYDVAMHRQQNIPSMYVTLHFFPCEICNTAWSKHDMVDLRTNSPTTTLYEDVNEKLHVEPCYTTTGKDMHKVLGRVTSYCHIRYCYYSSRFPIFHWR